MGGKLGHGSCPVAYLVLHALSKLGKALVIAFGNEDGIIAEATGAMLTIVYTAIDYTVEHVFTATDTAVALLQYQ